MGAWPRRQPLSLPRLPVHLSLQSSSRWATRPSSPAPAACGRVGGGLHEWVCPGAPLCPPTWDRGRVMHAGSQGLAHTAVDMTQGGPRDPGTVLSLGVGAGTVLTDGSCVWQPKGVGARVTPVSSLWESGPWAGGVSHCGGRVGGSMEEHCPGSQPAAHPLHMTSPTLHLGPERDPLLQIQCRGLKGEWGTLRSGFPAATRA